MSEKKLINYQYNRLGGIDAIWDRGGELLPYTLTREEAAEVNPDEVAPFDSVAYEQMQAEAQAKAEATQAKIDGESVAGHTISLTEENQNGIASVLQGAELAAEMGADFFPLNFNAMTAQGVKRIPFADMAAFKAFALDFLAARQKYFK